MFDKIFIYGSITQNRTMKKYIPYFILGVVCLGFLVEFAFDSERLRQEQMAADESSLDSNVSSYFTDHWYHVDKADVLKNDDDFKKIMTAFKDSVLVPGACYDDGGKMLRFEFFADTSRHKVVHLRIETSYVADTCFKEMVDIESIVYPGADKRMSMRDSRVYLCEKREAWENPDFIHTKLRPLIRSVLRIIETETHLRKQSPVKEKKKDTAAPDTLSGAFVYPDA